MMKKLNDSSPFFCIPMVGEHIEDLKEEASYIKKTDADFIEWRIDAFKDDDHLEEAFEQISNLHQNGYGVIFTPRDVSEGGYRALSPEKRLFLIEQAIKLNLCDYVDIEKRSDPVFKEQAYRLLEEKGIPVIVSYHDFSRTPSLNEIESLLESGLSEGQVEKFAFMPVCEQDVNNLSEASRIFKAKHPDRPLILIAMGELGEESRIFPEILNSSLSFASGLKSSAPGQVNLSKIRRERTC